MDVDPLLQTIKDSEQPRGGESLAADFQTLREFARRTPPGAEPGRFAAPDPGAVAADRNYYLDKGGKDDTFLQSVVRNIMRMALGSHNRPWKYDPKTGKKAISPEYISDLAMGMGPADLGPLMAGILAGKTGATNLGGQTLKKFSVGEKVAETGVPSQELWRSYGYAKGAEGKGRFEISDVPAQLRPEAMKAKTVGEALEHPELFAAYPDLAKIPLELRISSLMSSGHYNPDAEIIKAWGLGKDEAKSVLLHELQHAVQRREGFAPGANLSKGREAYEKSAGEIEAYNVQKRLSDPDLMRFTPEMTEGSIPRIQQIISKDPKAVMEAVKEPGGMWHPEAVERLADSLGGDRIERQYARNAEQGHRGDREALGENADQVIGFHNWSTRAIRNYLNKYAGTERPVEGY